MINGTAGNPLNVYFRIIFPYLSVETFLNFRIYINKFPLAELTFPHHFYPTKYGSITKTIKKVINYQIKDP